MENSTGSFAKTGQALADQAADKTKSSLRIAQETANSAGGLLSNTLDDVRSEAGTIINRGSKRAQSAGKKGVHAIKEITGQARDAASNATDSVVIYAKANPVKALAIAAATAALVYVAIRALTPSRN